MKHLPFVALLCLSLTNCSKSKQEDSVAQTTLEVIIQDPSGGYINGVTVNLYESLIEWKQGTSSFILQKTTKGDGRASFLGVKKQKYYFRAISGCMSIAGVGDMSSVQEGFTRQFITGIVPTGDIKVINISNYLYEINDNSTNIIDTLSPGESVVFKYVSAKTYLLVAKQLSGFTYPQQPIIKQFPFVLKCGETNTTTIP